MLPLCCFFHLVLASCQLLFLFFGHPPPLSQPKSNQTNKHQVLPLSCLCEITIFTRLYNFSFFQRCSKEQTKRRRRRRGFKRCKSDSNTWAVLRGPAGRSSLPFCLFRHVRFFTSGRRGGEKKYGNSKKTTAQKRKKSKKKQQNKAKQLFYCIFEKQDSSRVHPTSHPSCHTRAVHLQHRSFSEMKQHKTTHYWHHLFRLHAGVGFHRKEALCGGKRVTLVDGVGLGVLGGVTPSHPPPLPNLILSLPSPSSSFVPHAPNPSLSVSLCPCSQCVLRCVRTTHTRLPRWC